MSAGSYFPPPVKGVPIPKKSGGVRVLGVPTVSDRIAQTAVKMWLEPRLDPLFHDDSYGYRPGKSAHDIGAYEEIPNATPSANDTVVMAGTAGAITDNSGNRWIITGGGQVAANVVQIAYVNDTIWEENSSNLWWGETQPNDSWVPQAVPGRRELARARPEPPSRPSPSPVPAGR